MGLLWKLNKLIFTWCRIYSNCSVNINYYYCPYFLYLNPYHVLYTIKQHFTLGKLEDKLNIKFNFTSGWVKNHLTFANHFSSKSFIFYLIASSNTILRKYEYLVWISDWKRSLCFFLCALLISLTKGIYFRWFQVLSTVPSCTSQHSHSRAEQDHKMNTSQPEPLECMSAGLHLIWFCSLIWDPVNALSEVVLSKFTGPSEEFSYPLSILCVFMFNIHQKDNNLMFTL